jgi:hypothetical protein
LTRPKLPNNETVAPKEEKRRRRKKKSNYFTVRYKPALGATISFELIPFYISRLL